jgi:hypothetical protein
MTSCKGMKYTNLADSFINKGASSVFGFSDTVYSGYSQPVCVYILQKMLSVDPATNEYYTLEQALESAKTAYGTSDKEWQELNDYKKRKFSTAEPVIQGKADYQIAKYAPIKTGLYMSVTNDSNGFNTSYDTLYLSQDESGNVFADACWWNIAYGSYTWASAEFSDSNFNITYEETTETEPVNSYPYEASANIQYFGDEIYLSLTYNDGTSAVCRYEYVRPEQLVLTDAQLSEIASDLRVPGDLDVTVEQQEAYLWEAGARYITPVNILYNGAIVASASVDSYTGEIVKDILNYNG